jgi:hypothetical protein
VVVNNKTIFFLVVDLYPHDTSASKRPQPDVVEISEQEIVGAAAGPPVSGAAPDSTEK